MAIEIVDFPMKNGDFPWQNVSSPEGIWDFPTKMRIKRMEPETFTDIISGVVFMRVFICIYVGDNDDIIWNQAFHILILN